MTAAPATVGHGTASGSGALLTVVVPTYNERESMPALLARIDAALAGVAAEVLVVDDSDDGTEEVVREVGRTTAVPVRVLHRTGEERTGGLGGAVLAGLRQTDAPWVAVMDGDLQHPPEVLPQLLDRALHSGADLVVASRHLPGGSDDGLSGPVREWVSSLATLTAKAAFPRRVGACSDPMSGFFLVRRAAVRADRLRPDGFKILLEILARHPGLRVSELPFVFGEREAGDSKAGLAQGLVYARHLLRLRFGDVGPRLAGFLLVGASGLLPNIATTTVALGLGAHYVLATALATLVAASWNFALADGLLFRARRRGSVRSRWLWYVALSGTDIAVRVPVVAALVELARMDVLVASLTSIALMSLLRFVALDRWLYRTPAASGHRTGRRVAGRVPAIPAQSSPHAMEALSDVA
jgi:dolichol-phosphate mannosyltransferase